MAAGLPGEVTSAIDAYLRAVDDAAPGLVEGLSVVGSVALDDYHPAISDIDLVAVSRTSLSPATLGEFRPDGAFDANSVVWRVLATKAVNARGTPLTRDDVWFGAEVLRRWNAANLDGYWAKWVQWARGQVGTEARAR